MWFITDPKVVVITGIGIYSRSKLVFVNNIPIVNPFKGVPGSPQSTTKIGYDHNVHIYSLLSDSHLLTHVGNWSDQLPFDRHVL